MPSFLRPGRARAARATSAALAAAAASLVAAAASLAIAQPASAAIPPVGDGDGGVRLARIGTFDEPVYVDNAPGFPRLLFVVEKPGRVVALRDGVRLAKPFLDIAGGVTDSGEQGLLSIAFHPGYKRNGLFYVYFTDNDGDNELWRFKRSARHPARAAPRSGRRLLLLHHPVNTNHNGGQLQFGPDGLLYIGPGDGGAGGDPPNNAQNRDSLLGKLLRINPIRCHRVTVKRNGVRRRVRRCAKRRYRIPRGNPYVGRRGRDEIYSIGLRNPWRFSFDALSGAIAIGDVGQANREEIDFRRRGEARGVNFGWSRWEGTLLFNASRSAPDAIFPIEEYATQVGGTCAITGGYVVRDPRLAHQYGRYLYADFCVGRLRSLIASQGGARDDQAIGGIADIPNLSSFGEGAGRRLFVTSLNGPVYRVDP